MTVVHKNLTGADLHEPKGADTALSGQVYVANGSGSGVWTDATSIITNSAFTTGDTKFTLKTTADSGWILGAAGSIGDGSSGATVRADADTSALFTLLWTNFSNTLCPVSGGRGASAAADFAAHKTITLPDMWQRVLGVSGSYNGSGQSSRALGAITGTETKTLVTANLPPYTPSGTISGGQTAFSVTLTSTAAAGTSATVVSNISNSGIGLSTTVSPQVTDNPTFSGSAQGGTSTAFSLMQPTVFINIMIKL